MDSEAYASTIIYSEKNHKRIEYAAKNTRLSKIKPNRASGNTTKREDVHGIKEPAESQRNSDSRPRERLIYTPRKA